MMLSDCGIDRSARLHGHVTSWINSSALRASLLRVVAQTSFLLLLLASLTAAAGAQAQIATGEGRDTTAVLQAQAADSGRLLRPGDLVRLRIWREPDLSGDFPVDETGRVVFPKIGVLQVLHESPQSLKSRLLGAYQVYLRNPSVDVVLLRRVNVLGAVRSPGLYQVDPTMLLADVIAAAGGATPQGLPDRAQLIRDGQMVTAALTRRTRVADLPIRSGDQLFIPERNWAARNSNVVAAAITSSVSLVIALLVRR
jgi:polysaccharide export outer membrane protein